MVSVGGGGRGVGVTPQWRFLVSHFPRPFSPFSGLRYLILWLPLLFLLERFALRAAGIKVGAILMRGDELNGTMGGQPPGPREITLQIGNGTAV